MANTTAGYYSDITVGQEKGEDGEGEGGNGRENTSGDGHEIGSKLIGGKERKYGRLNRNKG
jgi:hypothetical protein